MTKMKKYNKWTEDIILKEALKFKSRWDFAQNNWPAYKAATYKGILDKVCKHMRKEPDIRAIRKEAAKYYKRSHFALYSGREYRYAKKRGILDDICKHMNGKPPNQKKPQSLPELELFKCIKNIHSSAKKMHFKVLLENKPHIKAFSLDIYIPELKKAIEFDGTYWHSLNGLKFSKARQKWPIKDLENYHEIKDNFFKTQGIQIIHIQESNWKTNKNLCIEQCLEFLNGNK